jgi:hypothetical protein
VHDAFSSSRRRVPANDENRGESIRLRTATAGCGWRRFRCVVLSLRVTGESVHRQHTRKRTTSQEFWETGLVELGGLASHRGEQRFRRRLTRTNTRRVSLWRTPPRSGRRWSASKDEQMESIGRAGDLVRPDGRGMLHFAATPPRLISHLAGTHPHLRLHASGRSASEAPPLQSSLVLHLHLRHRARQPAGAAGATALQLQLQLQ